MSQPASPAVPEYIVSHANLTSNTFDSAAHAYAAVLWAISRGDGGDPREFARKVLFQYLNEVRSEQDIEAACDAAFEGGQKQALDDLTMYDVKKLGHFDEVQEVEVTCAKCEAVQTVRLADHDIVAFKK